MVYLGWGVPVFGFLGVLVLAALVPAALRRWTPAAAAARADARLGLRDRLASLVDFGGRPEIPEEVRRAQARETANALAGATPAAAVQIARWRWSGPVLLAACLLYQFFIPVRERQLHPLVRVAVPVWRLAPTAGNTVTGEGDGAAGEDGPRGEAPATTGPPGAQPPAEGRKTHGQDRAGGKEGADRAGQAGVESEKRVASGDSRRSADRTRPAQEAGAGERGPAPQRIESQRVGRSLAKVVDPLYRGGAAAPPPAVPSGVATFHLLPQSGAAGDGGDAGGEALAPEPVRVDLDRVPAPYRPIVKAYFDQLARAAAPAGAAPEPDPARSRP